MFHLPKERGTGFKEDQFSAKPGRSLPCRTDGSGQTTIVNLLSRFMSLKAADLPGRHRVTPD